MAFHFDSYDQSLVIDGFEKGVADSPHQGISDMRNVNIISVPGEASVAFATAHASSPNLTATYTVTSQASSTIHFAGITGLENGMAIKFSDTGGLSGLNIALVYYVFNCSGSPTTSCQLSVTYSDIGGSPTSVTITGTTTTATFNVFNVGHTPEGALAAPTYFAYTGAAYFMQDGVGQVWSNTRTTVSGYWTFTGRSGTSDTGGLGLVYYQQSGVGTGAGYIFSFLQNSIDYFNCTTLAWTWGWKPSDGTDHNTNYLHSNDTSHEAQVAPDSVVYFCDGNWIGEFFQIDPNTAFDPTNTATYSFAYETALLPITDTAQCLSYIGSNILIGGVNNIIYSWDGFSPFATWILLPEYNVHRMVTVNTNTFIFVGNRGRIYVTNGTNAQLYKKIPDHISGTVEPYYQWGGACSAKNQLYFSALVTTNGGTAINQYGGVWAIDMDTEALRLANKLTYNTYAGYASAMIPNFSVNPGGTGLFIGWDDSTFHYGIDTTTSNPYTNSEASIDSDLIPIGTFIKPRDLTKIEYRLTTPLVANETVTVQTRLIFGTTDTGYTTTLSGAFNNAANANNYSLGGDINFANAQWVQFKIILNSTATTPSYVRIKELRVMGLVGPTLATNQNLSL